MPVFEDYELGERIGVAGNSFVATLAGDTSRFVVKVIPRRGRRDPVTVAGMMESARHLAMLSDQILPIYALGEEEHFFWHATAFQPLCLDRLAVNGSITVDQLKSLTIQTIKGLLNIKRVTGRHHGNLKGGNILLRTTGIAQPGVVFMDPAPANCSEGPGAMAAERQALARLIYELVTRTPLNDRQRTIVFGQKWKRLGANGQIWCDWCNNLFDTRSDLTLELLLKQLQRRSIPRLPNSSALLFLARNKTRAMCVAACAALVVGGAAVWHYRPHDGGNGHGGGLPDSWPQNEQRMLTSETQTFQDDLGKSVTTDTETQSVLKQINSDVNDKESKLIAMIAGVRSADERNRVEISVNDFPAWARSTEASRVTEYVDRLPVDSALEPLWRNATHAAINGATSPVQTIPVIREVYSDVSNGIKCNPGIPAPSEGVDIWNALQSWLKEGCDLDRDALEGKIPPTTALNLIPEALRNAQVELEAACDRRRELVLDFIHFYVQENDSLNRLKLENIKANPGGESDELTLAIGSQRSACKLIQRVDDFCQTEAFPENRRHDCPFVLRAWKQATSPKEQAPDEAQLSATLLALVDQSTAVANNTRADIKRQVENRWVQLIQRAHSRKEYADLYSSAANYGVTDPVGSVSYGCKIRLLLTRDGIPGNAQAVENFLKKVSDLKPKSSPQQDDQTASEYVKQLQGWQNLQVGQKEVGPLSKAGLGAVGWTTDAKTSAPDAVTFHFKVADADHMVCFRHVTGGKENVDCYLATTEVPVRMLLTAMMPAKPKDFMKSVRPQSSDLISDWNKDQNGQPTLARCWISTGTAVENAAKILGDISDDLPLQSISFHESKELAEAYGCRLPSIAEWLQACEPQPSDRKLGVKDIENKDLNWAVSSMKLYTNPCNSPNPSSGLFRSTHVDPKDTDFHDLIGNVAEWVTDSNGGAYAIGGSSLSGQQKVDAPVEVKDSDERFTDVGLRLAFAVPLKKQTAIPQPEFFQP